MVKKDSLFLGQFDSLIKTNFPFSLSVSQLFVAIEENKIPIISLNASQTVGIYQALMNEINDCLPIIKEILTSPAYIEVEIEKKVRRRCIFRRYKSVVEKISKYDILENKMIADLINKINWLIKSLQESKIFDIKTIQYLLKDNVNYEYSMDNFRSINRLYNGKVLKNVLDTNFITIEMQELIDILSKEFKELSNNRFSKYLVAQNIAIENNNIIESNENYKKCYELYKKLVALNCNNLFEKDKMTSLYREYILSIMTYVLKKHNYNTKEKMDYIYVKEDNKYRFKNLEFFNEIFTITIDNFKQMSFDVKFKIRNNVTLNVVNDDLEEVVKKMNTPQIKYHDGKLTTKDAVKGPLMRLFVETCKELYGKQEKKELINIYNKLSNALIEESECCLKLNIKFVISKKETLNNKDLSKLTINSAVNNIYNDYDSTIIITPSKIKPSSHFSKLNLNTFTLQNNILQISPSNLNVIDRIERIITEATLLLEGNNEIYKEVCPLCGYKNIRRKETGEYCCEECDGVWTANSINKVDTIWIKRIRLK